MTMTAQRPVTERQEAYLLSLADRKFDGGRDALRSQVIEPLVASGQWEFSVASKMIDSLLAAPDIATAVEVEPVGIGLYEHDGEIYKVQPNQSRTHNYVKRLSAETGEWVYLGKKPLAFLVEDDALTFERAAQLGEALGMCVNCARDLSDDRSQWASYGATCANNLGWPYPSAKDTREAVRRRAEGLPVPPFAVWWARGGRWEDDA